ncbi:MAG: queuine tRNA-ribosyltransferase, partial [Baekduia sp.]|nr:queuine tRNA-ribosyltransferase [Baekduia sp.]
MAPGDFTLETTDGSARAGRLTTAHGVIETPVFMPVGTRATVKGVDPRELEQLGAQIILGNTYHLHFRPGADLIEELGGLHRFMGWHRPLLTDSGGFQVFSLADTRRIDADGVTFRSVYDGSVARFTPELAMAVQASLGSDIAMAFDECSPAGAARADLERAVERTARWAERCVAAPRPDGQLRFGIAQGGTDRELRARSVGQLTALPFEGFAIGGLSVGEEREEMFDVTDSTAALLPAGRPRYFMGIGDPEGILRVIGAGIDMFDCVLPTRLGRTGSATTWDGRLNLRNARFARDEGPLQEGCECPACVRFSRAYIRHLVTQDELLGLRLLTLHNVHFLLELCRGARRAIIERRFRAFS